MLARRLGSRLLTTNLSSAEGSLLSDVHQTFVRFASKKQGGSTSNGRDSNPKYLGLKVGGGQYVYPGNIIVRQRGTKFHPAEGVGMGKDHTIFATTEGNVLFREDKLRGRKFIYIQQGLTA